MNTEAEVKEIPRVKRGCGFRYPGLYLFGMGVSTKCDRLPMKIPVCPCCGETIRSLRSVRIFDPMKMFGIHLAEEAEEADIPVLPEQTCECDTSCPVCYPPNSAGLMWIGERFYPTPKDFIREAIQTGVSKRIPSVPKGIAPGSWVFLAHPNANEFDIDHPERIVYAFMVQEIQQVLTAAQASDEKFLAKVRERGYVPVIETGPVIEIKKGDD
jgi:hypothetical protein